MRLIGRRAQGGSRLPLLSAPPQLSAVSAIAPSAPSTVPTASVPTYPILPLTPEAFAPFGRVLQSYADLRACPKEIVVKRVNFGTANKFNHLAPITFLPPPGHPTLVGKVNFCVFSSEPQAPEVEAGSGKERWTIKALERHEFSTQAFSPMGRGGGRYLVVVALPGKGPSHSCATRHGSLNSGAARRQARLVDLARLLRHVDSRHLLPSQYLAPPSDRPRQGEPLRPSRFTSHSRS